MTAPAQPLVPSYLSGMSEVPLLGDTIGDNFDRMATRPADSEALVEVPTGGGARPTASWWPTSTRSRSACSPTASASGDRVGIWSPNRSEWTLLQYATAKIGAILVNINPAYRTHELEYVLKQSGIRTLVAAPASRPPTTPR